MNKNPSKNKSLTAEQKQIQLLSQELEDAKLLAEGYRRMIELVFTAGIPKSNELS